MRSGNVLLDLHDDVLVRRDSAASWNLGFALAVACRATGVTAALDGWNDQLCSINPEWSAE